MQTFICGSVLLCHLWNLSQSNFSWTMQIFRLAFRRVFSVKFCSAVRSWFTCCVVLLFLLIASFGAGCRLIRVYHEPSKGLCCSYFFILFFFEFRTSVIALGKFVLWTGLAERFFVPVFYSVRTIWSSFVNCSFSNLEYYDRWYRSFLQLYWYYRQPYHSFSVLHLALSY